MTTPITTIRRTSWYHRLTVRLVLLGLLAVLAAVGSTSWVLLDRAEHDTLAARQILEVAEVERTASLLNERTSQLMGSLQLVAQQMPPQTVTDNEAIESLLRARPLLLAAFDSVFVASADGHMRVIHDGKGFRRTELRLNDRSYFRQVLSSQEPNVSEPVMGRVSGEPVVVFAAPVMHRGRVVGVLGGSVRLRSHALLAGMVGGLHPPGSPAAENEPLIVVTDAQANLVWHPEPNKVGQPVDQEPALVAALSAWAQAGGPVDPLGRVASDALHLGAYAGMPAAGWLVWRLQPRSVVLAPLDQARWWALVAGSAIALILAAGLTATLWLLLAPLRQLQARAERLFEPDLDPRWGWPDSRGELGELGAALQRVLVEKQAGDQTVALASQQLRSVLHAAPLAILLTRERCFELASPEACRLLGRDEAQIVGQAGRTIYASNQDYEQLGSQVGQAFAAQQTFVGEIQFLRGDGSTFWGRLSGRPVDWQDSAAGTIWTVADITTERQQRQELEWAANHDALTGLANRMAVTRQLDHLLKGPAKAMPAALLMMDLDRFKPINDAHGHAAGDAMLRAVGQAISTCVRGGDVVARLGGDEFAVILLQCPADVALRVAESICTRVGALRLPWQGHSLSVGISVGVAALLGEVDSTASWLAAADGACYDAKAAGRGTVRVAGAAPERPSLRLVAGDGSR